MLQDTLGNQKTEYSKFYNTDYRYIEHGGVLGENTNFITIGKNKFDISRYPLGDMIDDNYIQSGVLMPYVNYKVSNKIYLKPNTTYTTSITVYGPATGNAKGSMFDVNDNYIGYIESNTFTTPSNFSYVRFTVYIPNYPTLNSLMICEGSSCTLPYEPFEMQMLNVKTVDKDDSYVEISGNEFNTIWKYNSTQFLFLNEKLKSQWFI